MGGPCFIVQESGELKRGPPCTDNFQIAKLCFPVDSGIEWSSVEQCFQAQKYTDKDHAAVIQAACPYEGESRSEYGHRVWGLGQVRKPIRSDWDEVKVEIMYLITCAKFASNPTFQEELIETGVLDIVGGPSTWRWQMWNGQIQKMVRKQLQEGIALESITSGSMEEISSA